MTEWTTRELLDGRRRHQARRDGLRLDVYEHNDGRVDWKVWDSTGNILFAEGQAPTAEEARRAAVDAADKTGWRAR